MKIEVIDTFKSVGQFTWDNIPSLSIITGLNGAGKSQLLELIRTKPDIVQTDDNIIYKPEDITFWNSDGGRFPNSNSFQIYDLVAFAATLRDYADPLKKILQENARNSLQFKGQDQQMQQAFSRLNINVKGREDELIKAIEIRSGKAFVNMGFEEVMYHFPEHLFLDSDNISNDRIETLFYMYHFRKSMDIKFGNDVADYQTPPWELLNQVFEISNLPFEIDNPTHIPIDFDVKNLNTYIKPEPKYAYSIKLKHKLLNKTIDFKDISSGEKTIMSLAFLHYYAQNKKSYKKLLLLDEPDAHLHPSLTKQFLEVVNKFLIKQYGAKVIMTTHSPSTIGLCDEESIFIMSKDPTKIEKQTRSNSINYLTSGVPTLSSIVDNRRYVLVEDKDDVSFYTRLYNLFSKEISSEISLVFIPVSAKKLNKSGGCTVVREWTRKLRVEGEMNLAKGIIDRDKSNSPTDGISVLKRYSIENYFLDPLIIAGYLIHNGMVSKIDSIEFPNKNCNRIEALDDADLQKVADHVIDKVQTNFTATVDSLNTGRASDNVISDNVLSANELTRVTVELKNGKCLNYPKWLIDRRGHDLEDIFRTLFSNGKAFGIVPLLDIIERLPDYFAKDFITTLNDTL
ncbi:ATP-binding protein [Algoriphagus sp. AGSA1]|uniref:ATP-dependent nuclease n=1 Tax=Algoriphagus sp. AGSA1 TaxID=2907213 RepID=UPI001F348D33|nr:AAA family ATPase [Algoriphagus sp. AGSA1]MCE7053039.1 ATP-binding protein [Algoriphagus sp. AGSA1]